MIKKTLLCISLLTSTAYMRALVLESEILHFIDGTVVAYDSVATIKKYQKQVRHFLNEHHTINGLEQKVVDLALKEKNNTITESEKAAFAHFIADFVSFSEPFIVNLNPVKAGIAPLIEESCQKRNRLKSLLLIWIASTNGSEKEMFKNYIQTYMALGELCMDLLNFTEDLLSSCPKAMKSYNDFYDRFAKIEPLIDALLIADKVEISHHGVSYYDLVRYIADHYSNNEQVTTEKTAKLYSTYNIKSRL